ncbi:B-cell receptor CD22-like [Saccostrea cucullata]|uniref:B-cell receptor CD22-like n=1 Tax=Saccostrea cuccullata TaxID=36930 RepID=UPI002ED20C3D
MMLHFFLFMFLSGIVGGTLIVNPVAAPWLQMSANNVTEGQPITLKCTVHSSPNSSPVTWSWKCGNDNLTRNATSTLEESVLKINADRKYNGEACYCKVWPRSANETYSKMSNHMTINVKYAPRDVPFLNASNTVVSAGDEITLMCTLDSMGNPPIRWSWKCDRSYVYNRRVYNLNATSKLVLDADRNLNGKVCYCVAKSYPLQYEAASNTISLTVYSSPDGLPEIDKSVYFVDENTPVKLSCSLRSAGNPPVSWLWYCDNKLQTRGIKHSGSRSALTIIAQRKDHNSACYCRARSESQWGNYDKNSSKAIITIKSQVMPTSSNSRAGISAGVFGAVTGIFVLMLILAGVIIFIHHRRIEDIGKQFPTGTRESVNDTAGGQDNLNYRTLREEGVHSKD